MNVQQYLQLRMLRQKGAPSYRDLCPQCLQPGFSCYCAEIKRFYPRIDFVILIHPIEFRRRIATGRMSHLCLEGSRLIQGQDFTDDSQVNELIQDPKRQCVILYPGPGSVDLTQLTTQERGLKVSSGQILTVFVIDGTWLTAKKMMHQSKNLGDLERFCFSLNRPSNFRVRKQPSANCFSTIEAIHQTIELLGEARNFDLASRQHDILLSVFDVMVERQIAFMKKAEEINSPSRYRPHRVAHSLF